MINLQIKRIRHILALCSWALQPITAMAYYGEGLRVDVFAIALQEEIGSQVGSQLKADTRGRPKLADPLSDIAG